MFFRNTNTITFLCNLTKISTFSYNRLQGRNPTPSSSISSDLQYFITKTVIIAIACRTHIIIKPTKLLNIMQVRVVYTYICVLRWVVKHIVTLTFNLRGLRKRCGTHSLIRSNSINSVSVLVLIRNLWGFCSGTPIVLFLCIFYY